MMNHKNECRLAAQRSVETVLDEGYSIMCKEITFGIELRVGGYFIYRKTGNKNSRGVPIKIVSGPYQDTIYGEIPCHAWKWRRVNSDGSLKKKINKSIENGKPYFTKVSKRQAIELSIRLDNST